MNLKYLLFKIHLISIFLSLIGWIFEPRLLYLYPIVILSWKVNNNKCIISQLEYYFFKETFIGNGPYYYVPKIHRYIFYINFFIGLIKSLIF